MWSHEVIAETVAEVLARHDASLREEQAVYGLDSLDETALHPIIAAGLKEAGLGVLREQAYPTQWKRKRVGLEDLPLPRDRERCDLVLTRGPGRLLQDSLADAKVRKKRKDAAEGTLFASVQDDAPTVEVSRVAPDEAYWLELKVVAQYSVESGVPGPNRVYGSQLTRFAVADLAKLACDRMIVHAGLVMVHFTADAATAAHDRGVLMDRLLARALRIGSPVWRTFAIQDRIGNALCSCVVVPLRPAPPVDE